MQTISILGATGSIGCSALRVVEAHPDRFSVVALTAARCSERIVEQALRHTPELVVLADPDEAHALRGRLPSSIRIEGGREALCEAASLPSASCVLSAITGAAGLPPTAAAARAGKRIALANKESLVAAGELLSALVKEHGAELLPVDSEHSALFQCLEGHAKESVERLLLTASGGPFWSWNHEQMEGIGVAEALSHPTWSMGAKISVDSSTMMNKGLEVIEAHYLFQIAPESISVVIHPESIVHSMVQMTDGALLAHLGPTDMTLPIQYALGYPERLESPVQPLDWTQSCSLSFHPPDLARFPCLRLAYEALEVGKSLPAYMNGVNEKLVAGFLAGQLPWHQIASELESAMAAHTPRTLTSIEEVMALHEEALEWGR